MSMTANEATRTLLDRLSVTPVRLRAALSGLSEEALRAAPPEGGFTPIEDAWHLRDIECEAYLVRIRRILAERQPMLVSLDGDALALERRYRERDVARALDEFAQYREEILGILGGLTEEAWSRTGMFEGKVVTLRELVAQIVNHDEGHLCGLAGVKDVSDAA